MPWLFTRIMVSWISKFLETRGNQTERISTRTDSNGSHLRNLPNIFIGLHDALDTRNRELGLDLYPLTRARLGLWNWLLRLRFQLWLRFRLIRLSGFFRGLWFTGLLCVFRFRRWFRFHCARDARGPPGHIRVVIKAGIGEWRNVLLRSRPVLVVMRGEERRGVV